MAKSYSLFTSRGKSGSSRKPSLDTPPPLLRQAIEFPVLTVGGGPQSGGTQETHHSRPNSSLHPGPTTAPQSVTVVRSVPSLVLALSPYTAPCPQEAWAAVP